MAITMDKKLVPKYSTKYLRVYTVNPTYVCKHWDMEYVGGSQSHVDKYVPHGEIWVSNCFSPLEFKYYLLHEMYEYRIMAEDDLDYHTAHALATMLEKKARLGSENLVDKMIQDELNKQKDSIISHCHKKKQRQYRDYSNQIVKSR